MSLTPKNRREVEVEGTVDMLEKHAKLFKDNRIVLRNLGKVLRKYQACTVPVV